MWRTNAKPRQICERGNLRVPARRQDRDILHPLVRRRPQQTEDDGHARCSRSTGFLRRVVRPDRNDRRGGTPLHLRRAFRHALRRGWRAGQVCLGQPEARSREPGAEERHAGTGGPLCARPRRCPEHHPLRAGCPAGCLELRGEEAADQAGGHAGPQAAPAEVPAARAVADRRGDRQGAGGCRAPQPGAGTDVLLAGPAHRGAAHGHLRAAVAPGRLQGGRDPLPAPGRAADTQAQGQRAHVGCAAGRAEGRL